jgi:hypothetical protein
MFIERPPSVVLTKRDFEEKLYFQVIVVSRLQWRMDINSVFEMNI